MSKKFTARYLKEEYGFSRNEKNDFTDDGNKFKGYTFKGFDVTYLTSDGNIFLSFIIPSDVVENLKKNGTYDKAYELAEKFNYVWAEDITIAMVYRTYDELVDIISDAEAQQTETEESEKPKKINSGSYEFKGYRIIKRYSTGTWAVTNGESPIAICIVETFKKAVEKINGIEYQNDYRGVAIIKTSVGFEVWVYGICVNVFKSMKEAKEYAISEFGLVGVNAEEVEKQEASLSIVLHNEETDENSDATVAIEVQTNPKDYGNGMHAKVVIVSDRYEKETKYLDLRYDKEMTGKKPAEILYYLCKRWWTGKPWKFVGITISVVW